MKKLVLGVAALPFMVNIAMAGQPVPLSDAQMDKITAGAQASVLIILAPGLNDEPVLIAGGSPAPSDEEAPNTIINTNLPPRPGVVTLGVEFGETNVPVPANLNPGPLPPGVGNCLGTCNINISYTLSTL
jgi:hypothetical protein